MNEVIRTSLEAPGRGQSNTPYATLVDLTVHRRTGLGTLSFSFCAIFTHTNTCAHTHFISQSAGAYREEQERKDPYETE